MHGIFAWRHDNQNPHVVDADGRLVRLEFKPGQAADALVAENLLSDLRPGATILADEACDNKKRLKLRQATRMLSQ